MSSETTLLAEQMFLKEKCVCVDGFSLSLILLQNRASFVRVFLSSMPLNSSLTILLLCISVFNIVVVVYFCLKCNLPPCSTPLLSVLPHVPFCRPFPHHAVQRRKEFRRSRMRNLKVGGLAVHQLMQNMSRLPGAAWRMMVVGLFPPHKGFLQIWASFFGDQKY